MVCIERDWLVCLHSACLLALKIKSEFLKVFVRRLHLPNTRTPPPLPSLATNIAENTCPFISCFAAFIMTRKLASAFFALVLAVESLSLTASAPLPLDIANVTVGAAVDKFPYRLNVSETPTCNAPGEFCCPAPGNDVNNCPDSARSLDCDKKKNCCCG